MRSRFTPTSMGYVRRLFLHALTASVLAGCGGGGGGGCGSLGALVPSSLCDDKSSAASPVPANQAPTAVLQVPPTSVVGEGVLLDGTLSRDPEGKSLRYTYELIGAPTGSTAQLSNASGLTPSNVFVPDVVGVYQFRLTVSDGALSSAPVESTLTVRRTNTAPVARASAVTPSTVVGQVVTLDGSASSDDDRDLITYSWALVSRPTGSLATLSGFASARPSFVADKAGQYVASLTVNDGRVNSPAVNVTVQAGVNNVAPVAKIDPVPAVLVGNTVILSGVNSYDANGDNLRFNWDFASVPPGSKLSALTSNNTVRPSFVPDLGGDYLIRLTVNDGTLESASEFVRVNAARANQRPNALVSASASVNIGQTVVLDGTGSTDPNQDTLRYDWTVISKPQGAVAALQGKDAPKATLFTDLEGIYVVGLKVNDGEFDSPVTTHIVNATAGNRTPTAVATSQTATIVKVGNQVVLSGDQSSDPDKDLITYKWVFVSVPVLSKTRLANDLTVAPSFVPDVAGLYLVSLTVADSKQARSTPSTILIQAGAGNQPPTAKISALSDVLVGGTVVLDGLESTDPDLDLLKYSWSVISKPQSASATIQQQDTSPKATLLVDKAGVYVVGLKVSDGSSESIMVAHTITATAGNLPPTAVAESLTPVAKVGSQVVLTAARSFDPDTTDFIRYRWAMVSMPTGSRASLNDQSSVSPNFVPDLAGQYVFTLTVTDSRLLESRPVQLVVQAGLGNLPPVARIAQVSSAVVGSSLLLDGSGSEDPVDNSPITYKWQLLVRPAGSTASIPSGSQNSVITPFTPDVEGDYLFQLVVNDGTLDSSPAVRRVSASAVKVNRLPEARITPSLYSFVPIGGTTVLFADGSSDPEGGLLSYRWALVSRPAGSAIDILGKNSPRATLAPDVAGYYVVGLTVIDAQGAESALATTIVDAGPSSTPTPRTVALAVSPTISPKVGQPVTLDGRGSVGVGPGTLRYRWSVVSKPEIGRATIVDPTTPLTRIIPDAPGYWVFKLVVDLGEDPKTGPINESLSSILVVKVEP